MFKILKLMQTLAEFTNLLESLGLEESDDDNE